MPPAGEIPSIPPPGQTTPIEPDQAPPVDPEPGPRSSPTLPPPVIPEVGPPAAELPMIPGEQPGAAVPTPEPAPVPAPLAPAAAEPIAPEAFAGDQGAGALADLTSTESLGAEFGFPIPEVFGDSFGTSALRIFQVGPEPPPPLPRPPIPPRPPSPFEPVRTAALVPSIRAIKLSENQSPAPRDRLIYQFNFYNNVNGSVNRRFLAPISDIRIYRHIFGVEKTFFDGMASLGARLPLDTVTGDSVLPGVGSTETALGNLELFGKYVLYMDRDAGRLLSTGLAISPNTGPDRFAGADYLLPLNHTTIQPFVGGIFTSPSGRFFLQGFTSIQVPLTDPSNDVTILYNDYAVGYFLYRSADPDRWLRAITPVFEVHINTPLNHRGISLADPIGTPDFVNLTYGTAIDIGRRTRLLGAIVTPVTGPRPFDLEVLASLNIYY